MRTPLSRFSILLSTLLVLALPSFAQFSQRGSIGGVVAEASGAVVPKASVTLLDLDRNQTSTATTDATGHYEFSRLLPGNYQVSVELAGFKKSVSDHLSVAPQTDVRCDFQLQLSSVSETLTVTASSAPLLETESSSLDENISEQQIATLPINGRNFTSLSNLTPGVSTSPRNNINMGGTYEVGASYASGGVQYAAGGNTEGSRDNGLYVNGVNANENYIGGSSFQPSAEAISEAKVGVVDFSAEYGRDFTNFNVTTKSGTNNFHGEAYDFIENDAFDAQNPYDKATGFTTKAAYRFNLFGGNLGGPIYIPKIVNLKDRAFFFVNYERNPHSLTGPNNYAIVPSDAERAGNFGEICTGPTAPNPSSFDGNGNCLDPTEQLYNPYKSNQPIPFNNLATPGLINPASAGIVNLFPSANTAKTIANGGSNYQYSSRQSISLYHWDSRFDVRISSKDNIFVAWSKYSATPDNSGGLIPNLMQANANVTDKSQVVTVNEAHVFSSHLTNEFIFAIGSGALQTLSPAEVAYANSASNPFNSLFANTGTAPAGNTGILGLNIYDYGPTGNFYPTAGFDEYFLASNKSLQFGDNVTWIHGRHSMTFGFNSIRKSEEDFDNVRYVFFGCAESFFSYCANGVNLFTSSTGTVSGVGGDGFADVLLGLPKVIHQRYSYTSGGPFAPEPNWVIPYYGFYFNDKFQATRSVTISFGLRYDLPIPIFATNNLCCAIYQAATDTAAIPGIAPGLSQHYLSPPKHDFAPRLSLAWQMSPTLVLRAGYGLFFNSGANQISNSLGTAAGGGGLPGAFTGPEITPTTLGFADQSPVTSISQIFQASPSLPPGTYPVSTGPGQGYFGDGVYQTLFYSDQNSFRTPYINRYMLDIQKEVTRNSVITVSYIGATGRRGWYLDDINAAPYQTGWASSTDYNNARPYNSGRWGDIYVQRAGLNSNYNAGIVKFQRQMTHGLEILAHYTYAKALGDRGILGQGTQDVGYNYPQSVIPTYGELTFSHRHRFVLQTTYQPKYAQNLPRYLRPALGDWYFSAIATFESGDALTVLDENNPANDFNGSGYGIPNMVRNPNFSHSNRSFSEYFDTNAFVEPTNGLQGTAPPGVVRGPGQNNWDISFGKNIAIYENLHAEIRADMYNAFNHTQWTTVDTLFNDTSGTPFGQVTGGREGRIIQLAGKIVF
jgi:hypothetical protein